MRRFANNLDKERVAWMLVRSPFQRRLRTTESGRLKMELVMHDASVGLAWRRMIRLSNLGVGTRSRLTQAGQR